MSNRGMQIKQARYQFTLTKWLKLNALTLPPAGKDVEQLEPRAMLIGMQNGAATDLHFLRKFKCPCHMTQQFHSWLFMLEKLKLMFTYTHTHTKQYTNVIAPLFVIAKGGNNLNIL